MSHFLLIQASYYTYQVGLALDALVVDSIISDKHFTSRDLIPSIDSLLKRNSINLNTISAIGVNNGPGPFTSLRVAVTAANGIAFAQKVPLIGLNSLYALLKQEADSAYPFTVALLNAFHHDVYYAYTSPIGSSVIGCMNGIELLKQLQREFPQEPVRFIGDCVKQLQLEIQALFPETGCIPDPLPLECSLETLATITAEHFAEQKELTYNLIPLYLKQLAYAPSLKT